MRLGTRWRAGDVPPASVPENLRAQIRAVEEAMPPDLLGQPNPWWTLTWLEGRPVAELETGVMVTVTADGEVVVQHDPDDDFV
ncbi:hypothetical protein ABCS02_23730 [Microbacterium sp. X-17]|uniref:hypothetical protein n=1 Tax=Microbacterium sp. X-17 TaxID=3144404 RepID=UPI0031F598C6